MDVRNFVTLPSSVEENTLGILITQKTMDNACFRLLFDLQWLPSRNSFWAKFRNEIPELNILWKQGGSLDLDPCNF